MRSRVSRTSTGPGPGASSAGMLSSFERPARGDPARVLSTDLENCTAIANERVSPARALELVLITVKILRADGGCLGTRSR
jgi:hypothetical protein